MKQVDVVGAVIINECNEILCALRSKEMSLGGYWEFPGGKVEQDEDPKKALEREIQEELSCEIKTGNHITNTVYEYPHIRVRLMTYKAQLISGVPTPNEHEKLEWKARQELLTLNWAPADIPTVHLLCNEEI
ncbi:(deoxy)nucleoside triphosphate pyrophosphohydrolase [Paenibacillus sp. 2TAB26]|uniref:(deoxy)nucleoside triphosphate pyrophosphohydrolase n=1 Tax=Paenibacillus sp. 2TAB26 TaxID=3233005 RepID=UPI003F98F98B